MTRINRGEDGEYYILSLEFVGTVNILKVQTSYSISL